MIPPKEHQDSIPGLEMDMRLDEHPSFRVGGEVHAWLVEAAPGEEVPAAWLQSFSEAEHARAARFVFERDRRLYQAAHAALRQLLARYLGTDPSVIRYGETGNGKPFIAYPRTPVSFNLSHSGNKALISISDRETGADIEEIRPGRNLQGVAERYFTHLERERITNAPDREAAFYRTWAGKEAVLKARGTGLFSPMPETRLDTSAPSAACACYFRPDARSYACVYPVHDPKALRFFRIRNYAQFERSFPL